MNQYFLLPVVLQLRNGEMLPLTLHSISLPNNPTIDDFRRALMKTELAGSPYYAYLQRFCRFGYSTTDAGDSAHMMYIRPLRSDKCLQQLLKQHQEKQSAVTFYLEQTRSLRWELHQYKHAINSEGNVIPCHNSKISEMPVILQASAFYSGAVSSDEGNGHMGYEKNLFRPKNTSVISETEQNQSKHAWREEQSVQLVNACMTIPTATCNYYPQIPVSYHGSIDYWAFPCMPSPCYDPSYWIVPSYFALPDSCPTSDL